VFFQCFYVVIFGGVRDMVRVGCAHSETGFVIPGPNSVYKHYYI